MAGTSVPALRARRRPENGAAPPLKQNVMEAMPIMPWTQRDAPAYTSSRQRACRRRCCGEIRPDDAIADPAAVGAAGRADRLSQRDRAGGRRGRGGLSLLLADRDAFLQADRP